MNSLFGYCMFRIPEILHKTFRNNLFLFRTLKSTSVLLFMFIHISFGSLKRAWNYFYYYELDDNKWNLLIKLINLPRRYNLTISVLKRYNWKKINFRTSTEWTVLRFLKIISWQSNALNWLFWNRRLDNDPFINEFHFG